MFLSKGIEGVKLFTDDKMFHYMEELRYKMGYKAGPISYCSWQGKLRKGVKSLSELQTIAEREDFAEIFEHFEDYIETKLPKERQNNALDYYNEKEVVFKDE